MLLDLSAAFDTIDHNALLHRLETYFSVTGDFLAWFNSYLKNRTQSVVIDDCVSQPSVLHYGVPQGSVLGPLLFCCYTAPLGDIIRRHDLSHHLYADDTQIYFSISPSSSSGATAKVEMCISEVRDWMRLNWLKLNDAKTDVIVFGSRSSLSKIDTTIAIQIGDSSVQTSAFVKNLGIYMDTELNMEKNIGALTRSCYMHLHNIGRIRKYLQEDATKSIVHALTMSRLDYCNALMYGLPQRLIDKMQRVQNTGARIITRTKRTAHITPVLKDLHWLPVKDRITFKLLVITYKALHGLAPLYLSELVVPYQPSRALRSQHQSLLSCTRSRTKTYGDRSFRSASARLWNSLPANVRESPSLFSFKSRLKTHMFDISYGP